MATVYEGVHSTTGQRIRGTADAVTRHLNNETHLWTWTATGYTADDGKTVVITNAPYKAPEGFDNGIYNAFLLNRRIAAYRERGIVPIPDSECTDRGTYVVWNNPPGDCNIFLSHPDHVAGSYKGTYDTTRRAHLTKPVRVEGWFMVRGDDKTEVFAHVDSYGDQSVMMFNNRWGTYVNHAESVRPDMLPPMVRCVPSRLARLSRLRHKLTCHFGGASGRTQWVCSEIARLSGNWQAGEHRGVIIRSDTYLQCRKLRKQIGAMVGDWDADTSDIVELLDDNSHMISGVTLRRIVLAWNDLDWRSDRLELGTCGHVYDEDEGHSTHEGNVCGDCFDSYVYCEDTEEYHYREYVYCHSDECYRTYPEESDDYDYDEDRGDDDDIPGVRSYSTNVLEYLAKDETITVSPYGEFLMGVELEATARNHSDTCDAARDTTKNLCPGYAILKSDGSIGDDGFEIVTAPRGLTEHIRRFKAWEPHEDLRAWNGGKCGLHVHISSGAFTQATLGKFVEFISAPDNAVFIKSIAGRHHTSDDNAQSYCRGEGDLSVGNPKKTLTNKSADRYRMVNTTNLGRGEASRLGVYCTDDCDQINTVELRIFRASLKKERLLAQIEFAHAAVMFCRWSSMRELRAVHFMAWLQKAAGMYPNLAKWFGVKANTADVVESPAAQAVAEV